MAAAVTFADHEAVRDAMCTLRAKGTAVLHWHDESPTRRREIVARVAELDVHGMAAGCHPVAPKRQERARARLLTAMASDLAHEGVDALVIESRKEHQDSRDRTTLAAAQRAGMAPSLRYRHRRKSEEPLLWVADVIAGAVSMHLAGDDSTYFTDLDTSMLTVRELDP